MTRRTARPALTAHTYTSDKRNFKVVNRFDNMVVCTTETEHQALVTCEELNMELNRGLYVVRPCGQ